MRHGVFGRKLGRNTNERKRLLVNLSREIIKHGSIKTTLAKAKAVQPMVEKLITRAKKGKDAKSLVFKVLGDKISTEKLMSEAETRFGKRSSGFTRIVKMGKRMGDSAEEALFMFVDEEVKAEVIVPKTEKKAVAEKPAEKEKPKKESKPKVTSRKK